MANDATSPHPDGGPGDAGVFDTRTTGEVLASLAVNAQAMLRTEVELAKLEVTRIVREKLIAVGALVVAAVFSLFLLGFIGVTIAVALTQAMAAWLAWLLVTLGYALVVGGGVVWGVVLLKRSVVPEATKDELTATVAWAKEQVRQ